MNKKNNQNIYSTSIQGKLLDEGQSDFHHYRFVETEEYGTCLFLDGIIQSSSCDQHIYHERMTMQALKYVPKPKSILIIGGAGGGMLHHILKSAGNSIERIHIVDIDKKLYELAPLYMKEWCSEQDFADTRVTTSFENGVDFLAKTTERFDVILLDISDPITITKSFELYSEGVFKDICRCLLNNGVLVYHSAPFKKENFFHRCYENNVLLLSEYHSDKAYIASFESLWMFNVIKKKEYMNISK